jgi:four helix bundle protein
MGRPHFEELDVYKLSERLANEVWRIVEKWDVFAKDTVGKQMVRAADSICANIAEGRGRYNFKDNQRFVKIARGSLYETICWLRLAYVRQLIDGQQSAKLKVIVEELFSKLNAYIKSLSKVENR